MQLNITVKELMQVVEGESSLDPSFVLERIAPLEQAGPKDLAILVDPDEETVFAPLSRETIEKSEAGVILSNDKPVEGKPYLLVKDALDAFSKLVSHLDTHKLKTGAPLIDATAVVCPTAEIGANSCIGAHVVIESHTHIGEGCEIGAQAVIGKKVRIGNNVKVYPGVKILDRCEVGDDSIIHAGAVIGSDGFGYRITKAGMRKIPHVGTVKVGKEVEIGANSSIDRAAFEATVIGDGVKIDNLVHISHNVQIGPHTAILAHSAIAGSVKIGAGCLIGGQVAIRDHVKVGNRAKIVSKSGVMKDVADGEIVAGIPAVPFNTWKRAMVAVAQLPDMIKPVKKLLEAFSSKRSVWSKFFGS